MVSKNEISSLISQLDTQGDIQAEKIIQKMARIGTTCIPLLKEAAQNEEHPRVMKWSLLAMNLKRWRNRGGISL